ncbi:hypothetical protein ONV78_11640 [Hahella sp. CR1]|uniref:hypothetical protein n=1 Tax=Hahella sp. CR1 TaxID=2992807 RepID=UPI0024419400|nr:hypothetical protein [Hahella sp. CR1]MDG9668388.1 hypothetical protein [Hahella sp. CR1]
MALQVIHIDSVPDNLLVNLERRDVALWLYGIKIEPENIKSYIAFLGLPWRMIFSESLSQELIKAVEAASQSSDSMSRRRGHIQIIDSDPSRIELPQRCLPFYLLNGRDLEKDRLDFSGSLRRLNMMNELRRSGVRDVLILSGSESIPLGLSELWGDGFRAHLTISATEIEGLASELESFAELNAVNFVQQKIQHIVNDVINRYSTTYPDERIMVRFRDANGIFHNIDVTEADDPERPVFSQYQFIQERDLSPLIPQDLSEKDFIDFFRSSETSWRPYAAGLPWLRDLTSGKNLFECLKRLNTAGAEENCIAYIASEPGAGGTTVARMLAWNCAREGFPTLIAKTLPLPPDALSIVNFLNRVYLLFDDQVDGSQASSDDLSEKARRNESASRRYETPILLVFDSLHWQSRDGELTRFRNELEKSGRPVCMLIVKSVPIGLIFHNSSIFKKVTELNHSLSLDEAQDLGRHLNKFLRHYGKERKDWQWMQFHKEHTVRYLDGVSAFWVVLSFWIQGQYDLSESIQQWMYNNFKKVDLDLSLRKSILYIAALSTERLPLPEELLPESKNKWPTGHLLEDFRSELTSLGLVFLRSEGKKYWALAHDVLGRFLFNAIFYDNTMKAKLGLGPAKEAEHLRLHILEEISKNHSLGDYDLRPIADEFATTIFKIDPDHGRGSFTLYWREVLSALDHMPQSLRDASRVFRHHVAVSRRRIAKLNGNVYEVSQEEKVKLLERAVEDINYALDCIEYKPGSEPDVNLLNSLANAYFDLAKLEYDGKGSKEKIVELRGLANEATRKAYEASPTSPFVVETYVKSLLAEAQGTNTERAVGYCVEVLGILFSAISSTDSDYRNPQLGALADEAIDMLFKNSNVIEFSGEPNKPIEVLFKTWVELTKDSDFSDGLVLGDVPKDRRERAIEILSHPAGMGNMKVIRLSYDLICIDQPGSFQKQLELVEQLQGIGYRITPQLQLEYAILLFLNNRPLEGDKIFSNLRSMWKESEYFVQVPSRLHWLKQDGLSKRKVVHATSGSDYANKAMARVSEFQNILVPLRPEEFSYREIRPGMKFTCYVSFGHNGPFLRPATTNAGKDG